MNVKHCNEFIEMIIREIISINLCFQHHLDVSASHGTLSLDSGTRSLSSLWNLIGNEVSAAFENTQDLGDQVVLLEVTQCSFILFYVISLCIILF